MGGTKGKLLRLAVVVHRNGMRSGENPHVYFGSTHDKIKDEDTHLK